MEMTITRALAELKMLDKRINRTIDGAVFGGVQVGKKTPTGFKDIEDLEKFAKSSYQSIQDLIKRRNEIKSKIVVSNAQTKVNVAGKEMTVAEAIERKTSIEYEVEFLGKMKREYAMHKSTTDRVNQEVEVRLDKHLDTIFGSDRKITPQSNNEVVKAFNEQNEAKLIDPLNLKEKIEKLEKEIEDFVLEVDFVLSESNTLQKIEIND